MLPRQRCLPGRPLTIVPAVLRLGAPAPPPRAAAQATSNNFVDQDDQDSTRTKPDQDDQHDQDDQDDQA